MSQNLSSAALVFGALRVVGVNNLKISSIQKFPSDNIFKNFIACFPFSESKMRSHVSQVPILWETRQCVLCVRLATCARMQREPVSKLA